MLMQAGDFQLFAFCDADKKSEKSMLGVVLKPAANGNARCEYIYNII